MAGASIAEAFGQHWQKWAFGCLMTSAHLPAPSPMNRHGPCSRYSAKLFSSMMAGDVSVIWAKDSEQLETAVDANTAEYTSMRRASIIGMMKR